MTRCECPACERKRREGRERYRRAREEYLRNGGVARGRGRPRKPPEEKLETRRLRQKLNNSLRCNLPLSREERAIRRRNAGRLRDQLRRRRAGARSLGRIRRLAALRPRQTWAEYIEGRRRAAAERVERKAAERAARKAERDAQRAALSDVRRERRRASQRAWRAANRERHRELIRAWKRRNPEKVKARRVASRQSKITFLMKEQRGKCAYCRSKLGSGFHVDHIMPLARGGSNARSNLQLTCEPCNLAKRDMHPVDFARVSGMLV